ncbi:MAG TPA: hypothetical protein VFP40_13535 [Terriglobales bacterium]|nr:hypothetical protein [Terriglobales bacterium]
MVRLKSVGVLSVAKLAALMYGGIALLFVPVLVIVAAVMSAMPHQQGQPPAIVFVVFALIAPFFYAAMGFVLGALSALIYNLAAGWLGGIEMHFESVMPVAPVQPVQPVAPTTLPPTSPPLPQA